MEQLLTVIRCGQRGDVDGSGDDNADGSGDDADASVRRCRGAAASCCTSVACSSRDRLAVRDGTVGGRPLADCRRLTAADEELDCSQAARALAAEDSAGGGLASCCCGGQWSSATALPVLETRKGQGRSNTALTAKGEEQLMREVGVSGMGSGKAEEEAGSSSGKADGSMLEVGAKGLCLWSPCT